MLRMESLNEILFPQELVDKYQSVVSDENFGSELHLKKLFSQFNFIEKMFIELELRPDNYKTEHKRIFKYFTEKKISVSYSKRLISLANRWGYYVSRLNGQFFEPIPPLRGRERSKIADEQRRKSGKQTELGVRTESRPLTRELLNRSKSKFSKEEHWNWMFVSFYFGLRPSEVDSLHSGKYKLKSNNGTTYLQVYQSKLMSLPENQRYKSIPLVISEQNEALKILKSEKFKRPLTKTVRAALGEGVTLYAGRKGFTDLMLEEDYPIEQISIWLGHRSIETTWKYYKQRDAFLIKPKKRSA